ncbi:hypothetical protein OROMI_016972 [Orobanche minor]
MIGATEQNVERVIHMYLTSICRKRSSDQFEFEVAAQNITEAGRSSSRASDDGENGINTRKNSDYLNNSPLFLAEHEDIDDVAGSEELTECDHGVDLQQPLLIKIDSFDSHQK